MIWTRSTGSISYDDNHYAKHASAFDKFETEINF